MAGGKKSAKKSKPHESVKSSTSEETSTMTSEITKKKAYRTGHRNSTERKIESANEILLKFSEARFKRRSFHEPNLIPSIKYYCS